MTCEIHDYCGSAHAHLIRMIAFASYISQLDNNNTRASGFGYGLASEIETNSSADIILLHAWLLHQKEYTINKNS